MLSMSSEETAAYARDGYIVRKNLLDSKEIGLIFDRARVQIEAEIREGKTAADKKVVTKAEEDQYGFLGREERLVDLAQDAIGEPIYRYRHVIMPNVDAYNWHQDFPWFFDHGLLAPRFATIYLPFGTATRDNGCIRVLKGSHKLGRLNHLSEVVDQVDPEQFEAALKLFEVVYVEMEPGDVMVFDGNLLHGADANRTDTPLWTYHCYYTAVENVHYKEDHQYGHYEPLEKVSASSFLMPPSKVL